jgi:hypothetical protein
MRVSARVTGCVLLGAVLPVLASAQSRTAVEQERREFAEWVATAALSPRRAVEVFPVAMA